jgi:hypothetical protein
VKGSQLDLAWKARRPSGINRKTSTSWFASAIAALAVAAFHIAIVGSVLLSESGSRARVPRDKGLSANDIAADVEPTATLILIEDPGAGAPENPFEQVASRGSVLQNLRLTIISPEPTMELGLDDQNELKNDATSDSTVDRQAGAALFGLYLGQIQARVQRAWLKPRIPIGAELFECRARVLQSARGEVKEVVLQDCNGDARWQLSLVHAIEQASPFPAPPDPVIFAESLQLAFHSREFIAGSNEEGFEPAGMQTALAIAPTR